MARRRRPVTTLEDLSRRERQIMDILLELGEATAEEVRSRLPDPPSYSAARTLLSRLEQKGLVSHRERDLRYVFAPTLSPAQVRKSALSRLVKVFFHGSAARAVTGLVQLSSADLSDEELDDIAKAIEEARAARGSS